MKKILFPLALAFTQLTISAQTNSSAEAAYLKVVTGRAEKIVQGMKLEDSAKAKTTVFHIAHHYNNLNNIYARRDTAINQYKRTLAAGTKPEDTKLAAIHAVATASIDSLHPIFLKKLGTTLNETQIEQVKDGLTYGVLPITWAGYQDMLPNLTAAQKTKIYNWLVEAREHAMDAESSERKHGWFGKYKGRINNYLSAEGYNMKEESKKWEERVRARKNGK